IRPRSRRRSDAPALPCPRRRASGRAAANRTRGPHHPVRGSWRFPFQRMRGREPRHRCPPVYKPYAAHIQAGAIGRGERTVDHITRPVRRFLDQGYRILGGMPAQRFGERLPVLHLESVFAEKCGLAPSRPMCCRKQIADDLVLSLFPLSPRWVVPYFFGLVSLLRADNGAPTVAVDRTLRASTPSAVKLYRIASSECAAHAAASRPRAKARA